jgi:hypothetical protein
MTKMAQSATMGGLWEDFIIIFLITKYLQKPIYIWNNISKYKMFQCGMDFQFVLLHIAIIINILK